VKRARRPGPPLGGGLIKTAWFKSYAESELPARYDEIVQNSAPACRRPAADVSCSIKEAIAYAQRGGKILLETAGSLN